MDQRFLIPLAAGMAGACNPTTGDWELTGLGGYLATYLAGSAYVGEMEIDEDGEVAMGVAIYYGGGTYTLGWVGEIAKAGKEWEMELEPVGYEGQGYDFVLDCTIKGKEMTCEGDLGQSADSELEFERL
jgi:hypothetical protein